MLSRGEMLCGLKLRTLCMIIGYFHLVSSVVDVCCHFVTVGIVTNGFQCDVDGVILKKISNLHFLEPILLVLNLGTHGFYPFPPIIRNQYSTFMEHMAVSSAVSPNCYPGVLHVSVDEFISFIINIIWLKFVIGYVKALHKREYEPMKMFVRVSILKLVMQVLCYPPQLFEGVNDFQTYWLLKIIDIVIAFYLLMVVNRFSNVLKVENEASKPPSYFESLIGVNQPSGVGATACKKNAVIDFEEVKKAEVPQETSK